MLLTAKRCVCFVLCNCSNLKVGGFLYAQFSCCHTYVAPSHSLLKCVNFMLPLLDGCRPLYKQQIFVDFLYQTGEENSESLTGWL